MTERVRDAVEEGGASRILGLTGTALAITKGIVTAIVAIVTILFMTVFMLHRGAGLDGALLRACFRRARASAGAGSATRSTCTVGGYVTGNLLISIIAGMTSTIALLALGVPYAVALGLLVAILDLIPLAGATIAAIIVCTIGFLHARDGRDHPDRLLRPLPAAREPRPPAARLQPDGAALAARDPGRRARRRPDCRACWVRSVAIPVAGTIQVLLLAWLEERRKRRDAAPATI